MTTENRRSALGHLSAFCTILVWGTTFVSTKVLLRDFTPVEILFIRFVLGYIALLLIYPHRLKIGGFKRELLFIGAGFCGVTLYFLFQNIALTYTLASNAGVIVSVAPLLTAVLAHFFLRGERLRPQFFAGFFIAIAGIILIAFNGSFVLKLNPLGDILIFLAALSWAFYLIFWKKVSSLGLNTIACTRRVFLYGILFMIPALWVFGFRPDPARLIDPVNLLNLLFLGLGASALCFVSWNWAVGVLGAVKTSFYIYAIPVITIVSSALLLHERITAAACAGAAMTLAGLFISERKVRAREPAGLDHGTGKSM